MKQLLSLLLIPFIAGCGSGFDQGAARTTPAEARRTCRLVINAIGISEADFVGEPISFDDAVNIVLDSMFQEVRIVRDFGATELETSLAADQVCLTSTDPFECDICWTAIIASVYDE